MTTNPGKFREVAALLEPLGIRTVWKRRALPEPQATTLEEVVQAKLRALPRTSGWTLVEDSGLFMRGIRGFPGVYSAYAYETIGLEGLLRLLEGKERAADFRTVAGLRHGRLEYLLAGHCPGLIADAPRGTGGFGFDPIFIPEGRSETFAQMPLADKNELSHRARAIRAAGAMLIRESRRAPRTSASR